MLNNLQSEIPLYDFAPKVDTTNPNIPQNKKVELKSENFLDRFYDAFVTQRQYDKLLNQSSSKKNFIYSRMHTRNKIIEDLGIEAPSIFRPGLNGYNQESIDYIENQIDKIRSSLSPALAQTIPTYNDFLNEAKVTAEELEAILFTSDSENDENFFNQFTNNYLSESTEGKGILGIPGTNNLLGVSAFNSLIKIAHNYDLTNMTGHLAASFLSSLSDPITLAIMPLTLPARTLTGLVGNTAIGTATEGFLTKYYINPWRAEIGLAEKDMSDIIKDSLIAGGVLNTLHFGVSKFSSHVKKVSNYSEAKRADNILAAKIDVAENIENNQVSDIIEAINNNSNLDDATNALNPEKYLNNAKDNLEKNLYTKTLEKIGFTEDIDGVGSFRDASARAQRATIEAQQSVITGAPRSKLSYSEHLRTELTLSLQNSKTPDKNLVDFINTFTGNKITNQQDFVSIIETEMEGVNWRAVNKNSDINLDLPKEIYNQVSNNPAANKLAKSFKTLTTEIRRRYKNVGLELNEIENYLPQSHNETLLRVAGFQKWRDFINPLLDWGKIEQAALVRSGRAISSREEFLSSSYRNIINNGVRPFSETLETIEKTGKTPYVPESALKTRIRNESERILFFKDGDNYTAYHQEFGNYDNIISNIDSYIQRQSKNLTLLQQFGDNPSNTIKSLNDSLEQILLDRANLDSNNIKEINKTKGQINSTKRLTRNMYDTITGNLHLGDVGFTEKVINDGFNIVLGASLTRVGIQSALLNPVFSAITGSRLGLNWMNILKDHVITLQGLPKSLRRQLGLISELESMRPSDSRFVSVHGHNWSNKVLRESLKYTGYYWFQDRAKSIFQKEFFATLGRIRHQTFEQIIGENEYLGKTFRENGIIAQDWDAIRSGEIIKYKGLELLSPRLIYSNLNKHLPDGSLEIAANKFTKMILQEQAFAVPEGSIKGASIVGTSSNVASRLIRPIITAPLLFSNFPLTAWYNTQKRWLHEPLNLGKLFLGAMAVGGSYVALRDLNDGKIPKVDFKFFADSFYYSGLEPLPVSWIQDSLMNSFAKRDPFSLFGNLPLGGARILKEEYKKLVDGKGNPGREFVKLLRQNIPIKKFLGLDLVVNRLLLDQIQKELDPQAHDYFRNQIRNAHKRDQEYYWAPGE